MINKINKVFLYTKVLLLFIAFLLTVYITMYMYLSLEMKPFGKDFLEFFLVILPFVVLLMLFVINISGKEATINDNIFYNITCIVVMVAILYMELRAMFDQNMVLWHKTNYHINFDYFKSQLSSIRVMLYGLSFANLLLIVEETVLGDKKVNK